MKSIKIGYKDEITQEDLEIPVTVTKVTWMWNEEGYAKQFFGQKPKSLLSLTKSQTWRFSYYSKEQAIEWLGKFCGYNKYAYRTIIKYDNEVIFDGKLMENVNDKDKELLLKDLSARVPYGVMVNVDGYGTEKLIGVESETITTKARPDSYSDKGKYPVDIVKPYLRSLSSITSDEEYEYYQIRKKDSEKSLTIMDCGDHLQQLLFPINSWVESISWLNAHHFDYRGLIEQGLAIEVTEKNNPYEQLIQDASIKVGIERDIKTGIQTHAQMYSLWTQSELFKQLTREQQRLYAKEIEQACISGGFNGVKLAKDPRCKENLEGKEE